MFSDGCSWWSGGLSNKDKRLLRHDKLRLIDNYGNELSDWFAEETVLKECYQCLRLSSAEMRRQLY